MTKILVTFLGTANYAETCYQLNEEKHKSKYTSVAIAKLCEVNSVKVLATEEAEKKHGEQLKQELTTQGVECELIRIPSGSSEQEQWNLFESMRATMQLNDDVQVVVDITSGFRVQPFFVSSVISMLRATEQGCHNLQLLYGEYHKDETISPIWDLTLFVELQDWVQALHVFLQTGHADALNTLSNLQDRKSRKAHFLAGGTGKDKPKTEKLVSALRVFADDLNTVRVAAMLIGYHEDKNVMSSSQLVLTAIEECREDIQRVLPPLGGILDDLKAMLESLPSTTLSGTEGHASLLSLAKLYQGFGRYAEAATVVREGYICFDAPVEACDVGQPTFDEGSRQKSEEAFRKQDQDLYSNVADVRNDLNHAGFRSCPLAGVHLKDRVDTLVKDFAAYEGGAIAMKGKTYFVSRHSGAVVWAQEEGFHVDEQLKHLDMTIIQKGDTVIGSLPVNLVAEICQKGASYLHLSLNLTAELRGKELSPADMRACEARLEAFQVSRS